LFERAVRGLGDTGCKRCQSTRAGLMVVVMMMAVVVVPPDARLMAKPVAVPQTTGSRIATAGFVKTKLGRVKLGRWLVMVVGMTDQPAVIRDAQVPSGRVEPCSTCRAVHAACCASPVSSASRLPSRRGHAHAFTFTCTCTLSPAPAQASPHPGTPLAHCECICFSSLHPPLVYSLLSRVRLCAQLPCSSALASLSLSLSLSLTLSLLSSLRPSLLAALPACIQLHRPQGRLFDTFLPPLHRRRH